MAETLLDKTARAVREIDQSRPGRRVETFQPSSDWINEHAIPVDDRVDEGHESGGGRHG